jgi:hypothetical protein
VCYTKIDVSNKLFFNTVANTGSIEVSVSEVHRQKERKKERKKEKRKKERKKETNKQKTTAKERKQSRRIQILQPFKSQ